MIIFSFSIFCGGADLEGRSSGMGLDNAASDSDYSALVDCTLVRE
jgi:hypothetical protein